MGSAFTNRKFGSTGLVFDETPGGSINGSNTVFTAGVNFVAGSLRVYKNGVRLEEGASNDFTVTGVNEFTLATAPTTGTKLLIDYSTADNVSGNADTLDGKDSTAFWEKADLPSPVDVTEGSGYIIIGGTQIAWASQNITLTASGTPVAYGINWPRAFSATPTASLTVKTSWSYSVGEGIEGLTTTSISGFVTATGGTFSRTATVMAVGIGAA